MIISERVRWTGHIAHIVLIKKCIHLWVRKPEGKRLLGGYKHRWQDNMIDSK
jgi:hypothetical protein